MAAPCALVSSCSETDPKDIIKRILDVENLPQCADMLEGITAYPWRVDTKYYVADINLCCVYKRTIGDREFADNVHAFVVHFDSNDKSSFDRVKMWAPFLKEINPEVMLLVCDKCDRSRGLSKEEAWAWCLENAFELIELEPDVHEQHDEEDDFQETVGMKRIVQALQAHTWPNLEMKDESTFRSPYMNRMMQEEAESQRTEAKMNDKNKEINNTEQVASDEPEEGVGETVAHQIFNDDSTGDINTQQSSNDTPTENVNHAQSSATTALPESVSSATANENPLLEPGELEQIELFGALAEENKDEESFEKLFEKLRLMKEKAETMHLGERKKYAEQVAIQFWQAIGGDEEEIAGLSDSD